MLADSGASAMQAAHHGAGWDTNDLGGLGVGESLNVDEVDDLEEFLGQSLDALFDGGVVVGLDDLCFRPEVLAVLVGQALHGGIRVSQQLWTFAAHSIDLGVAHDGEEPGARVATIEAKNGALGAEHCVLYEVFGIGRIASDGSSDPVEHRDLGHDVTVEGFFRGPLVDDGLGHVAKRAIRRPLTGAAAGMPPPTAGFRRHGTDSSGSLGANA